MKIVSNEMTRLILCNPKGREIGEVSAKMLCLAFLLSICNMTFDLMPSMPAGRHNWVDSGELD